jgi:aldehyde dehydrogenase (NAD+)
MSILVLSRWVCKNAIMVMDDADIDLAIAGAIWGPLVRSGKRCTASFRGGLIVHKESVQTVREKLVDAAKSLRVGNGVRIGGLKLGPVN